ncbi:MAG: TonB-dependent receptor [Rhodospirillales bacterium]
MLRGLCGLACASTALPLAAELTAGNPTDSAGPLETIVVSAAREPLPVERVGSAISVIDRDTLARRQLVSLGEMLRSLPGIAVSRAGGLGAQSQLRVRGAEANHVLVLLDGVPVNDPGQNDEFNIAHLFNHQLDQVEFLRGPQSSLWGSDALAGVISINTRRPEAGHALSAFVEGGSDNYTHAGANVSVADERGYVRFSARSLGTDGHNIARVGSEDDGYQNDSASLRAGWQVTDALALTTSWHYIDSVTDFDSVDFATGLPTDRDNESDTEQLYGSLTASLDLLDGRWRQQLSIDLTEHDNVNHIENAFAAAGFERSSTRSEVLRLRYQSHLDVRPAHTLSFAAEHESQEFAQRGVVSFFGDPNRDESLDAESLAFEYRGNLSEAVFVQASVRHDMNDDFDDATTWRANGAWWLSSAARLRVGIGTGVKNPTFSDRFGFFTNFVGNPDLKPERSASWEVGYDQQLGRDLNVSLTYFRAELKDEINGFVFLPAAGAYTAVNGSGESERQGVELSAQWSPVAQLKVSGTYSWIDATQEEAGRDVDEIRRPRNTGSLEIAWQPTHRWSASVRADHNGAQDDLFFPPVPPFQERVELDDFTLLSLTGEVALTDWLTLHARVENALDENYEEIFGFATPGRTFVLGMRVATNRK